MSRFNNPNALPALASQPSGAATGVSAGPTKVNARFRPTVSPPDQSLAMGSEAVPNMLQIFCFLVVNAYLLSACANDLIFHFTRGKVHISAVCVILLPLLFLGTGTPLRGLWTPTGMWFAAFAAWLAVAAPFSVWKGGSASMLVNYVPRAFLMCFYLAASAVTVQQVRTVVRVVGIGALFVIVSCYAFGGWIDGRFAIPDSLFFSNANELALQLLLGIIVLMYPFFEAGKLAKLVSVAGIFVSLSFMLKTGSRGVLIATLATAFLVFLMSGRRVTVVLVAVTALVIAFVLAPTEMRHRILLIGSSPAMSTDIDASAIGSRFQREKLLRTSIVLAISNPLFGVGPGQFAVKVAGDQEKKGEHADWLGTHNSYTQVASEAGLPAFIFYVATIVTCMLMDYRIYRRSRGRPGLESIAGMSFCMFLSTFAYSIAIFFFHEAYSLHLPLMAGISISLYLVVKPILERFERDPEPTKAV
jgi:O-antigen ligase